jgi:predicted transposase YdaD
MHSALEGMRVLMEEVLIRRYHELDCVEIRRMFKLQDLRKTRVWQEAHEEGIEKGIAIVIEKGIDKRIEKAIEKAIEIGRALETKQLVVRLQANGRT